MHIRAVCSACRFVWFAEQTAENVAIADAAPPFGKSAEQGSLFDESEGGEA